MALLSRKTHLQKSQLATGDTLCGKLRYNSGVCGNAHWSSCLYPILANSASSPSGTFALVGGGEGDSLIALRVMWEGETRSARVTF